MSARATTTTLALLAAAALVAAATLLPRGIVGPLRGETFSLVESLGVGAGWGDLERLANALLFVPFGAALAALARRWWLIAVPAASAVSALVELLQSSVPGRVPDLDDVVWNTAGAAVGAVIVALVFAVRAAVRRRAGSRARAVRPLRAG